MAHTAVRVRAKPEDVFDVLLDAHSYPRWVVGARRLREVDPGWPAPGSRFHHALGVGPLELHDTTCMLDWVRPQCVALEARFRPAGTAKVTITVRPDGAAAVVEIDEQPLDGPVHGIWGRLVDRAVRLRNAISLKRLRRLVERRAAPGPQTA
jgi:uncharacterized protein YndB with AHSA1/START domain